MILDCDGTIISTYASIILISIISVIQIILTQINYFELSEYLSNVPTILHSHNVSLIVIIAITVIITLYNQKGRNDEFHNRNVE